MIDIDQGQSGASAADREGFQQLVAEVSLGRAGIVLGLECSRLARNSADWHQLLELCGMTGTLICDEDGLYDPRNFNDRLLLGMKGQMSEAELHFIRARLRGGILSKARRGELITPLPVGLAYDPAGHVILDPDTAVRKAVAHLFATFAATGSATACVKAFNAAGLSSPGGTGWDRVRARSTGSRWPTTSCCGSCTTPATPACSPSAGTATSSCPAGTVPHRAAPRGMDLLHPRRAPRIHHPGAIRRQPRPARPERRRARPGPHRRAAPRRPRAAAGHHHLRDLRAADDRPLPPAPRPQLPAYVCQRDGIEHARRICQAVPGAGLDQRSGSCSSTPSPRWPSRPPSPSPPNSSTAPTKPTPCAPPTSSAPATTPTWPAAATSPSTPPTGSSPTPSKPTGTPRSAH